MKTILLAKNTSELLYQLKVNKDLKVVGGCTSVNPLPEKFITIRGIPELSHITRHERFIEVGPGATLAELLAVGKNHLPQVLYEALSSIANPMIRNIATVGGNICAEGHQHTLFAPLMALETKLEIKSQTETKLDNIQNFTKIPEDFVVTNIRIPISNPDISIFRRIGPENSMSQQSASFAFLATTDKNTLTSVKIAFAGIFPFRSKTLENMLAGHRLPLTQKDLADIQQFIAEDFHQASMDQMISDVLTQQFLNLVRYSFEQLT